MTKTLAEFRRTHEEAGLSEVSSFAPEVHPAPLPASLLGAPLLASLLARRGIRLWPLPSAGLLDDAWAVCHHALPRCGHARLAQVRELLTPEQWEAIRDVASPASYFV